MAHATDKKSGKTMIFWMQNHRMIKRIISVTALFAFVFTFVLSDAWATIPNQSPVSISAGIETEGTAVNIDTFSLPYHLGRIEYKYKGNSDRTVIHIQDAHCNKFAQHKISEIIEYLSQEYDIDVVNLEGGCEDYDLGVFTDISSKDIRKEVSDYFLKTGEINGAEFFAVNNPDKVKLWGIENKELYIKNLKVYRESLENKERIDSHLEYLSHVMNNLKRHIYSQRLLEMDIAYNTFKAGNKEFKDYLIFLVMRAKDNLVEVKEYPNLYLLSEAVKKEKDVDFKKANIERNILIDELKRKLSKYDMQVLVTKSLEFKTKRISQKDFYNFLSQKAKEVGINTDKFPKLKSYLLYVNLYEAVDKYAVSKEMEILENKIKETLFENDTQRELSVLSKDLAIIKNIFSITLTKYDYEYYMENKEEFKISSYLSFIEKYSPIYKLTAQPDADILYFDKYLEDITKFYEYSFERDQAFVENMKFNLGSGVRGPGSEKSSSGDRRPADGDLAKPNATIMITGGFHTDNLYNLLKEKDISCISIMPKFVCEENYGSPYFELLAGRSINMQRMLASAIAKAGALAIAAKLCNAMIDAGFDKAEQYAFKCEVNIQTMIAENKGKVKIVIEIDKDKGEELFFGDPQAPETEKLALAELLNRVGGLIENPVVTEYEGKRFTLTPEEVVLRDKMRKKNVPEEMINMLLYNNSGYLYHMAPEELVRFIKTNGSGDFNYSDTGRYKYDGDEGRSFSAEIWPYYIKRRPHLARQMALGGEGLADPVCFRIPVKTVIENITKEGNVTRVKAGEEAREIEILGYIPISEMEVYSLQNDLETDSTKYYVEIENLYKQSFNPRIRKDNEKARDEDNLDLDFDESVLGKWEKLEGKYRAGKSNVATKALILTPIVSIMFKVLDSFLSGAFAAEKEMLITESVKAASSSFLGWANISVGILSVTVMAYLGFKFVKGVENELLEYKEEFRVNKVFEWAQIKMYTVFKTRSKSMAILKSLTLLAQIMLIIFASKFMVTTIIERKNIEMTKETYSITKPIEAEQSALQVLHKELYDDLLNNKEEQDMVEKKEEDMFVEAHKFTIKMPDFDTELGVIKTSFPYRENDEYYTFYLTRLDNAEETDVADDEPIYYGYQDKEVKAEIIGSSDRLIRIEYTDGSFMRLGYVLGGEFPTYENLVNKDGKIEKAIVYSPNTYANGRNKVSYIILYDYEVGGVSYDKPYEKILYDSGGIKVITRYDVGNTGKVIEKYKTNFSGELTGDLSRITEYGGLMPIEPVRTDGAKSFFEEDEEIHLDDRSESEEDLGDRFGILSKASRLTPVAILGTTVLDSFLSGAFAADGGALAFQNVTVSAGLIWGLMISGGIVLGTLLKLIYSSELGKYIRNILSRKPVDLEEWQERAKEDLEKQKTKWMRDALELMDLVTYDRFFKPAQTVIVKEIENIIDLVEKFPDLNGMKWKLSHIDIDILDKEKTVKGYFTLSLRKRGVIDNKYRIEILSIDKGRGQERRVKIFDLKSKDKDEPIYDSFLRTIGPDKYKPFGLAATVNMQLKSEELKRSSAFYKENIDGILSEIKEVYDRIRKGVTDEERSRYLLEAYRLKLKLLSGLGVLSPDKPLLYPMMGGDRLPSEYVPLTVGIDVGLPEDEKVREEGYIESLIDAAGYDLGEFSPGEVGILAEDVLSVSDSEENKEGFIQKVKEMTKNEKAGTMFIKGGIGHLEMKYHYARGEDNERLFNGFIEIVNRELLDENGFVVIFDSPQNFPRWEKLFGKGYVNPLKKMLTRDQLEKLKRDNIPSEDVEVFIGEEMPYYYRLVSDMDFMVFQKVPVIEKQPTRAGQEEKARTSIGTFTKALILTPLVSIIFKLLDSIFNPAFAADKGNLITESVKAVNKFSSELMMGGLVFTGIALLVYLGYYLWRMSEEMMGSGYEKYIPQEEISEKGEGKGITRRSFTGGVFGALALAFIYAKTGVASEYLISQNEEEPDIDPKEKEPVSEPQISVEDISLDQNEIEDVRNRLDYWMPGVTTETVKASIAISNSIEKKKFTEDTYKQLEDKKIWNKKDGHFPVLFVKGLNKAGYAQAVVEPGLVIVGLGEFEVLGDMSEKEKTAWLAVKIAHEAKHIANYKNGLTVGNNPIMSPLEDESTAFRITYECLEAFEPENVKQVEAQKMVSDAFKVIADNKETISILFNGTNFNDLYYRGIGDFIIASGFKALSIELFDRYDEEGTVKKVWIDVTNGENGMILEKEPVLKNEPAPGIDEDIEDQSGGCFVRISRTFSDNSSPIKQRMMIHTVDYLQHWVEPADSKMYLAGIFAPAISAVAGIKDVKTDILSKEPVASVKPEIVPEKPEKAIEPEAVDTEVKVLSEDEQKEIEKMGKALEVINRLERDIVDFIVTPNWDYTAESDKGPINKEIKKVFKKSGMPDETVLMDYDYFSDSKNDFEVSIKNVFTKLAENIGKRIDENPKALVYVPYNKKEETQSYLNEIIKDMNIKERITIVGEEGLSHEMPIDQVNHMILGKGLLRYRRLMDIKDLNPETEMSVKLSIARYINSITNNPEAIDLEKDPDIIKKILEGGLPLPLIAPITGDWKEKQEATLAVLRSL